MKKILMIALVAILGLVSCTKETKQLVGTWKLQSVILDGDVEDGEEEAEVTLTFKANGTYEFTPALPEDSTIESTGKWAVKGSTLTFGSKEAQFKLSGKTLTIYAEDGEGEMVFTKI